MRWALLVGLLALTSALVPSAVRAAEMRAHTGVVEAIHGDAPRGAAVKERVLLRTATGALRLPARMRNFAGQRVRMLGTRRGTRLVRPRVMSTARPRQHQQPAVGHDPWYPAIRPVLGERRVGVLLVSTAEDAGRRWSAERMRGLVFGPGMTVAAHMAGQSRGLASVDGDVHGWLTIAGSETECEYWRYGSQGREAAAEQGIDLSGYDHLIVMFPRESCGFNGLAEAGDSYINGEPPDFRLLAHELGHNLGLPHANAKQCSEGATPTSMAGTCRWAEYGDPFDVMGHAPRQHFHGFHRGRLGWIPESEMPVVEADRTYALRSVNDPGAGTKVLLVQRPIDDEWSQYFGRRYFAVEYRTPSGPFEDFAPDDPVVQGVTIRHVWGPGWYLHTELIDTTPGTPAGHRDATLRVGERFLDPATGMAFDLRSVSDGVATVRVGYPPTAPTGVAAGLTGDDVAELRWQPGSDAEGVSGYAIERDGQVVGHTGGLAYRDTGLPRGREVRYRVLTMDGEGNDTASAPVAVTTPPLPGASATSPAPTTVASRDRTLPRLRLSPRVGGRLPRSRKLVLRGTDDRGGLLRITASLDGRRLRTVTGARVVVRLPARALRRRHRMVLTVTDAAGNRRVLRLRIVRGVLLRA